MNYRHLYHAGGFADVCKHSALIALLQALQHKEKGFCYIDTHAGTGRYDLNALEAQKTREYTTGIELIGQAVRPPAEIQALLDIVKTMNPVQAKPRFYPGSPRVARSFLRPQDRAIFAELQPEQAEFLKQEFSRDKQVRIEQQDGYQLLKAVLPPKERRGLVLIDPPYEQVNEVKQLGTALQEALKRWETGIYAVWYPLKERHLTHELYKQLQRLPAKEILLAELSVYPDDAPLSLNGSGMAIINPPWQLDTQLKKLYSWLWPVLSPQRLGGVKVALNDYSKF